MAVAMRTAVTVPMTSVITLCTAIMTMLTTMTTVMIMGRAVARAVVGLLGRCDQFTSSVPPCAVSILAASNASIARSSPIGTASGF